MIDLDEKCNGIYVIYRDLKRYNVRFLYKYQEWNILNRIYIYIYT